MKVKVGDWVYYTASYSPENQIEDADDWEWFLWYIRKESGITFVFDSISKDGLTFDTCPQGYWGNADTIFGLGRKIEHLTRDEKIKLIGRLLNDV
jgi:hypothetical protein